MQPSNRLIVGNEAPDFAVKDAYDRPLRLKDFRGKRLLLSFYRFASCPFCNLRVHRLLQLRDSFAERNLHMVAVFQSAPDRIRSYVGKQDDSLPILPDPEGQLYSAYGIEASRAAVLRAALTRLGEAATALAKGFVPGDIDSDATTIPADFVVDEHGILRIAYYGRDIGDHLPVSRIESFLSVAPPRKLMVDAQPSPT